MKMLFMSLLFALTFHAQADVVLRNPKVEFTATGRPAMIKIKGEGQGLRVDSADGRSGCFQFDLSTLRTGIEKRDDHMKRKYLEFDKHPRAEFTFKEFDPSRPVTGRLKLHGVERSVPVRITRSGDRYRGEFEIKLSDFQIDIPSFAGIRVADLVQVATEFELESKK